jgi:hypothetical protein
MQPQAPKPPPTPDVDYNEDDMDIVPISDPSSVTKMQKLKQAEFVWQSSMGNPLVNQSEALRRMYEAADVPDLDKLIMPPGPPPPDPEAKKVEAEMLIKAADAEQRAAESEQQRAMKAEDAQMQRAMKAEEFQMTAAMKAEEHELKKAEHAFKMEEMAMQREMRMVEQGMNFEDREAQKAIEGDKRNFEHEKMGFEREKHGMAMQATKGEADGKRIEKGLPSDEAWEALATEMQASRETTEKIVTTLATEISKGQEAMAGAIESLAAAQMAPKRVVKDAAGKPVGIETVKGKH